MSFKIHVKLHVLPVTLDKELKSPVVHVHRIVAVQEKKFLMKVEQLLKYNLHFIPYFDHT